MSNNQQDSLKVASQIFDTQEKFDCKEAAFIAKKMNWKYFHSEGDFATEEEIRTTLGVCVNGAVTQYFKNLDAGTPFKFISFSTGRVTVRVDFFNHDSPQVQITFGMVYYG